MRRHLWPNNDVCVSIISVKLQSTLVSAIRVFLHGDIGVSGYQGIRLNLEDARLDIDAARLKMKLSSLMYY